MVTSSMQVIWESPYSYHKLSGRLPQNKLQKLTQLKLLLSKDFLHDKQAKKLLILL